MRKRVFEPVINLGNLISLVSVLAALFVAWSSLAGRVSVVETQVSFVRESVDKIEGKVERMERTAAYGRLWER